MYSIVINIFFFELSRNKLNLIVKIAGLIAYHNVKAGQVPSIVLYTHKL